MAAEDSSGENGSSGPIIIYELLCFILNKWNHMDVDTLLKLCVYTSMRKKLRPLKIFCLTHCMVNQAILH